MDFTIVHFTLTLFLFQTVNGESEIAELTINLKISMLESYIEELEYSNTSMLSKFNKMVEVKVQNAQLELENEKMQFGVDIIERMKEIQNFTSDMTKIHTKIEAAMSVVYDLMTRLWEKENRLLKKHNLENPIHIEDFYRRQVSESLLDEYSTFLNRFLLLRSMIYEWRSSDTNKFHSWNFRKLNIKFMYDNEDTSEIFSNDANDEEKLPKFDIDAQTDELERIQRFALIIQDQLDELPRPKNDEQNNHVESEPNVPRWLLTERDVEQIRIQYSIMIERIENTNNPAKIATVKEIVEKNGYSMKYFCKTAAEYFVASSVYYDCATKDDAECMEIMTEVLFEKRFEKFIELSKELHALKLLPLY